MSKLIVIVGITGVQVAPSLLNPLLNSKLTPSGRFSS
jgi:hypothetical protein